MSDRLVHSTPRFAASVHADHPRVCRIVTEADALAEFFDGCRNDSAQSLQYVPYSRFVVARRLRNALGSDFPKTLKRILHERHSGALTIGIGNWTDNVDDFIKFATAIAHLIGIPNFDAMTGKYYARFAVEHEDTSDSYLRQAYRDMALHTDGTYVTESTDWILMMKLAERHAVGGCSRLLHLDDWEDLERFRSHRFADLPLSYRAPPSKNVAIELRRPTFEERNGRPVIAFINQFAYPETIEQAEYLRELSRSMERSSAVRSLGLPVGELVLLDNRCWLHGRGAFTEHPDLYRELLRLRGRFAET